MTKRDTVSSFQKELLDMKRVMESDRIVGSPVFPEFARIFELCEKLAHQHEAISVENKRFRIQLAEMSRSLELASRIDPMTGLANRRHIMEKIDQEASRINRHQGTFSLIMADIDDFRKINDIYGFNAGDEVLVEVATVFRSCIRSEDICARWGGEEFLFLLPQTSVEGALAVAQKIHESIAMTEFRASKQGNRTTVSLGVCGFNPEQTVLDCINKANEALLQAKRSGKNRYFLAA